MLVKLVKTKEDCLKKNNCQNHTQNVWAHRAASSRPSFENARRPYVLTARYDELVSVCRTQTKLRSDVRGRDEMVGDVAVSVSVVSVCCSVARCIMFLSCCACIHVCIGNIVNMISWKVVDVFSPNLRHWCMVKFGLRWTLQICGLKGHWVQGHCGINNNYNYNKVLYKMDGSA